MLRRVARVLRMGLLLVGLLLLGCLPLSYFCSLVVTSPVPFERFIVWVNSGAIRCHLMTEFNAPAEPPFEFLMTFARVVPESESVLYGLLPRYDSDVSPGWRQYLFSVPFWLLAFLCLAWPVTSFIIARRQKRGFPVVQTEVSDQKSEVSQSVSESTEGALK